MAGRVLTNRIELDGGEAITRQLAELGAAGRTAFQQIRDAIKNTANEGPQLQKSLDEIRAAAKRLKDEFNDLQKTARDFDRSWRKLDSSFRFTLRRVTILSAAIAGTAAGLFGLALGAARAAENDPIAKDFVRSFDEASKAVTELKSELLLLFAPGFTRVTEAFTQLLEDNRLKLLEIGAAVRDAVVPVFEDVISLLSGREVDVQNQWVIELRDGLVALGGAFKFLYNVARTIFNALEVAIQPVANAINSLFGTDLTARQIIVTTLLAKFLGVFRIIGAVAGVVVNGLRLFGGALGFISRNIVDLLLLFATFSRTAIGLFSGIVGIVTGFFSGAFTLVSDFITGVFDGIQVVVDRIAELFGGIGTSISEAFTGIYDFVAERLSALRDVAVSVTTSIQEAFTFITDLIVAAFNEAIEWVKGLFTDLASSAATLLEPIVSFLNKIIDLAKRAANAIKSAAAALGFADGGAVGMAGGGSVRGPGTGTSDSIWARLSNGEFVIKASAVRKYGRAFFDQLNSMRFNRNDVPSFNLGGLVDFGASPLRAAVPISSNSGSNGPSGQRFSLHIGEEVFDNLIAPDNVADRMIRFALVRQQRSAGKKPLWFGK